MHTNISRTFEKVGTGKLGSFNGDGVGGVSEGSEWGNGAEKVGQEIANIVTESLFAIATMVTAKEVITKKIKRFATEAVSAAETRWEDREAKATEESGSVDVVGEAMVFVLAGHAVKRERHPGGGDGGRVRGKHGVSGKSGEARFVV